MAQANVQLIVDAANAVNPLKRVTKETAKTEKQIGLLQKAVKLQKAATEAAATKLYQFGDIAKAAFGKAQKAAKKYQSTLGGLKGAVLSLGVAALTKRMIGQAASFAQTQVRLKALSTEYGEFGKIQQLVKDNAKTFNQSQAESASNFSDVYARLRPLGTSLEDIQTVYKGFNATALASGTSAAAASGAFLQLSQALGSGRLQGDEFRSIAEQVPGILRLVADEMGVTVGELKKLGSDGKITSDILINSLAKGFEENKDKIQALLAESPAQKFKEFSNATSELSNAIGTELLPVVTPMVQELTKLLKAVGDLPGPIKTAGAALIGLSAVVLALASPVSVLLKGIAAFAPAATAGAGAAKLLAGAMVILKGAMLALPWVALAAGITAIGVAIYNTTQEKKRFDELLRSGSVEELSQKSDELSGELLEAEKRLIALRNNGVSPVSRAFKQQKKKVEELQSALKAIEGTYKVKIEIEQLFKGGTPGEKLPKGYSRAADGTLVYKVGDVTYEASSGNVYTPPTEAKPPPTSTKTGSTAKGPDPAEEAEKLLKQQLEAGAKLSQQFTRQIQLREASSELAREELQIEFARQDAVARIVETAEISQQAALKELANKVAFLDVEKARAKVAAKQASDQQERDKAAAEAAQRRLEADPGFQMQKQFEELIKLENQVAAGATAIGSAFSNAFVGVISGAKSAQEGLAEMMQSVAKHFLDMAAKIIAQQIAIILYGTIMKALGVSMPGGSGFNPGAPSITGNSLGDFGGGSFGGFMANGGPVSANTPYIVGEEGPELMIPSSSGTVLSNSDTRQQLNSQQNSATRQQLNSQQSTATREQLNKMTTQSQPLNIRFESQVINGVEYVTADQHRQGMTQAAERGRAMTLTTLQNSPRTRSKISI